MIHNEYLCEVTVLITFVLRKHTLAFHRPILKPTSHFRPTLRSHVRVLTFYLADIDQSYWLTTLR